MEIETLRNRIELRDGVPTVKLGLVEYQNFYTHLPPERLARYRDPILAGGFKADVRMMVHGIAIAADDEAQVEAQLRGLSLLL